MVREALEAALAQTLEPHEIVISDDASTDGAASMLDAFARRDPRVRVLRQRVNTGGVANWNRALEATTGDYIAWCSDDDCFLPDHLEASVGYLEAHPEVALVHSGFIDRVVAGGVETQLARPLRSAAPVVIDRSNLIRYLIRYYDWPFHPSTLVFRRAVVAGVGRFNTAYALADTDWFVRVAGRYRVAGLPRYGVVNRRHAGNWSNRVGSARMQAEIFSIVAGAIGPGRALTRLLWRANVRARLLLTIRARLISGHAEAAHAAWLALLNDTGQPGSWMGLKPAIERAGNWLITRSGRGSPRFRDARESVSPL